MYQELFKMMVYNGALLLNIFWPKIKYICLFKCNYALICNFTSYLTVVRFVHV